MKYVVYDNSGAILRTCNCPESMFHLQKAGAGEKILAIKAGVDVFDKIHKIDGNKLKVKD